MRMKKSLGVLLLLIVALAAGTAPASEPGRSAAAKTFFTDDPVAWATPTVVLPPTFPQEALEKRVTAVVDATLKLRVNGTVEHVVSITSEPKLEVFESALKGVLKFWFFAQSYDGDCRPVPAQSRIRVWFDLKEGKPSISVTHVPEPPLPGASAIEEVNRDEIVAFVSSNYPRDARRNTQMADVYAKLTVDPRSGQTRTVDIRDIAGPQSIFQRPQGVPGSARVSPRSSRTVAEQFGEVAREGLSMARFARTDAHGDGPIAVCRSVQFR
jgi:hypothetical protein